MTDLVAQEPVDASRPDRTRSGRVEMIHIADASGSPVRPVDRIEAIAGIGLNGDRHARRAASSANRESGRDITLVAAEEIDRLAAEFGIVLAPGETRRNLTTRGIDLNGLVGRRFRIGDVTCEATGLCEPCQYLTDLLGKPILQPLVHRAGITARILGDGEIGVGDRIAVD